MCEPAHSIVQYPTNFDDSDLPFGGQMDTESRVKILLGKVGTWATKIGKWFHVSKLGSGHSAALGMGYKELRYLPQSTDYEGFWWRRDFKVDGWNKEVDIEVYEAAKHYHNLVCMGSIKTFRRFFETSLQQTNRINLYVDCFLEYVLTKKGRDAWMTKMKSIIFGTSKVSTSSPSLNLPVNQEKLIKITMGYTRKRNLFVPEWADDHNFWK